MKHSKKNYEDFSLSLALFDALPVLFFSLAILLIAIRFQNILFITGAILCVCAGLGKVIWKIILAASRRDIFWLNRQLRFLMPTGFLLIILGVLTGLRHIAFSALLTDILAFPAVLCFSVTLLGMILMSIFAFTLDASKSRSNWIEQITNAIAQGCLLMGVLICILSR